MRLLFALICSILLVSTAKADILLMRVVVLSSAKWPSGYVTKERVTQSIEAARFMHRLHSAPFIALRDVRYKKDPAPQFDGYDQMPAHLTAIRASSLHREMMRNVDFVYYVVPPLTYPGGPHLMGGLAGKVCPDVRNRNALAIGNMRTANDYGLDRAGYSNVIMAHELGHLIGMYHVQSLTLMHPNALPYLGNGLSLTWDETNLLQMRVCSLSR